MEGLTYPVGGHAFFLDRSASLSAYERRGENVKGSKVLRTESGRAWLVCFNFARQQRAGLTFPVGRHWQRCAPPTLQSKEGTTEKGFRTFNGHNLAMTVLYLPHSLDGGMTGFNQGELFLYTLSRSIYSNNVYQMLLYND